MKKRDLNGFSDDSYNEETNQVSEQIMSVYNSGVVIPSVKLDENENENENEMDNLK